MKSLFEVKERMLSIGVKGNWKYYTEEDAELVFIKTNKFEMVDGRLRGSEILIDENRAIIWTSKTKIAKKLYNENKKDFKLHELDHEAVLYVPVLALDSIAKRFGAQEYRKAKKRFKVNLPINRAGWDTTKCCTVKI